MFSTSSARNLSPSPEPKRQRPKGSFIPNPKLPLRGQVHEVMRFFHYSKKVSVNGMVMFVAGVALALASRWSPRLMTWEIAPGTSTLSLRPRPHHAPAFKIGSMPLNDTFLIQPTAGWSGSPASGKMGKNRQFRLNHSVDRLLQPIFRLVEPVFRLGN